MKPIKLLIFLFFGALLVSCFLFFKYKIYNWLNYAYQLNGDETEWINQRLESAQIKGIIFQLDKEGNSCFRNLIVKSYEQEVGYGIDVCNKNRPFFLFTSIGDSILKESNSLRIQIKKPSGEINNFDWPM